MHYNLQDIEGTKGELQCVKRNHQGIALECPWIMQNFWMLLPPPSSDVTRAET